jgi:hypothetical protein
MLAGKRFRLTVTTLGIENLVFHRQAVQIPEDEVITVLSDPRPDERGMIDVLWNNRTLVMFAEDIEARGQEIVGGSNDGAW